MNFVHMKYFPAENVKEDADASCSAYALWLVLRTSLYKEACEAHTMPTAGPETFAKQILHICEAYTSHSPSGEYFTHTKGVNFTS